LYYGVEGERGGHVLDRFQILKVGGQKIGKWFRGM